MAVTPQQRRAALIALALTASASGGYIAKDQLITIGQRFCGPTPHAVLVYHGQEQIATPEAIKALADAGIRSDVKLTLGEAQGLLANWCNPDRQQLTDVVETQLTKGAAQ